MSVKINPFTGLLDVTASSTEFAEFAEKISDIFDCDIDLIIGDIVTFSTTIANKVESLDSNIYSGLAVGVIISKPTSTTCEVLFSGKVSVSETFSLGRPIFIGEDGKLTTTKPNTGHLQKMGMSMNAHIAFLLPSTEKVIQA